MSNEDATEKTKAEATQSTDSTQTVDSAMLGMINDLSVNITVELGRTQIKIRDLLTLTKDSILDLNKSAGDPVDIYANGKLIARGNIISANGKYSVRLTSMPDVNN